MPVLLYIDDTEADAELVRMAMEHEGIETDIALSGKAGLAAFDDRRHDAVVIDHNIPDMSGPDIARRLREACPDCAILLVSGLVEKRMRQVAASLAIEDFLEKDCAMHYLARIAGFVKEQAARKPV